MCTSVVKHEWDCTALRGAVMQCGTQQSGQSWLKAWPAKLSCREQVPDIQTVSGLVVTENMKHKVVHILNLKHLNLESKRHSQLIFPVTRGLSGTENLRDSTVTAVCPSAAIPLILSTYDRTQVGTLQTWSSYSPKPFCPGFLAKVKVNW